MAEPTQTGQAYLDSENNVIWEKLSESAYDRTIESVRSFCYFMRDLYIPDSDILEPPPGGWPQVKAEAKALTNKSDKVIKLLKNMTYIKCGGRNGFMGFEMFPDTTLVDYHAEYALSSDPDTIKFFSEPEKGVPPDFIGLVEGPDPTQIILLEANYGIVYWIDCPYGDTDFGSYLRAARSEIALAEAEARDGEDGADGADGADGGEQQGDNEDKNGDEENEPDDDDDDSDDDSEGFLGPSEAAWPVESFFEVLKSKYRSLEILPSNDYQVCMPEMHPDGDEWMAELKSAYLACGWPGDNYRKEECAAEVQRLWNKHWG